MLGRKYLRAKVMQFLYAQYLSNEHPAIIESNLLHNIEQIFNIYIYFLSLLLGLQYSTNIVNLDKNKLLTFLSINRNLRESINTILPILKLDYEKDLLYFVKEIPSIPIYKKYCSIKHKSFKDDKNYIVSYYAQQFSVSEHLFYCAEDNDLTYINDLYIAHVLVLRR